MKRLPFIATQPRPLLLVLVMGLVLSACHSGGGQSAEDFRTEVPFLQAPDSDPQHNTESYDRIVENEFDSPLNEPYSTFAIDVDGAAYANMRRFINQSQVPPAYAIRTEELVNYFSYDYPQPQDEHPFSITTEMSDCPWAPGHQLVHIGLQGKEIPTEDLPASNLVFLLDVSGSMNASDKLPLLKSAFRLLVEQLRPEDRVAIVVYAGAAGLVLEPTPGDQKFNILEALERLEAGGSTAGGEGLKLAYEVAQQHFLKDGNNRVILATDGDFNVGPSSDAAMERLIEEKRESGVFLTVLGFGTGNYKDSKMQALADKGNGNAAYIDNILEAKKVLVQEFGGTLFTIAKDVKIQVEFNPAKVKGYRLIGYENRLLAAEDFNDDKKDAGELGSGHTVTALYEIIPAGSESEVPGVDPTRYQTSKETNRAATQSNEIMFVKFRYKAPDGDESQLIEQAVGEEMISDNQTSPNFKWSAAVVELALLLRDSKYKAESSYEQVLELAHAAKGEDANGYRAEFINLVQRVQLLSRTEAKADVAEEPSE